MPSLTEKLKSLGVKIGAGDLAHPKNDDHPSIDRILKGQFRQTYQGETFVVDESFNNNYRQGNTQLSPFLLSPGLFSDWVNDSALFKIPVNEICFLDIETTGLSGGTGTLAFLIGAGRYIDDRFHLAQFFLHEPINEPALLVALEEYIAPCNVLVTFNGKTFDIPILRTRYQLHGWKDPLSGLIQIDLLHLARRLWRDRLPNRSLINLETQILQVERSGEDIPGWLIPQLYFDYLRDRDPLPLLKVLYHNSIDVLSIAALLNYCSKLISDPLGIHDLPDIDVFSLAKFHEDLGHLDTAINLFLSGLDYNKTSPTIANPGYQLEAIMRLARIYKRRREYSSAIELWKLAVEAKSIDACIELAKFYEHIERQYDESLSWIGIGLEITQQEKILGYDRQNWVNELIYRKARVEKKIKATI